MKIHWLKAKSNTESKRSFLDRFRNDHLGKSIKIKCTYIRPITLKKGKNATVVTINIKKTAIIAGGLAVVLLLVFMSPFSRKPRQSEVAELEPEDSSVIYQPDPEDKDNFLPGGEGTEESPDAPQVKEILDLSENNTPMETDLIRINEPVPWKEEIIYSGGNVSLHEAVLTKLFCYNIETKTEEEIASTKIQNGEIFEYRFNDYWFVWLDTNHGGINHIYAMNRNTKEVREITKCGLNKPRLALTGNNLIWVEQKDSTSDSLYLYNFTAEEMTSLEYFNDPTYGTCPPVAVNNALVWVAPNPGAPGHSLIKRLDLANLQKHALLNPGIIVGTGGEGNGSQEYETPADFVEQPEGEGILDPQIIDPNGFAIYPATNGKVIAWLDHMDPSKAALKLTWDGVEVITVAECVGRIFGVGDKFVAYTQEGSIMVYFWETNTYARISDSDETGRLAEGGVMGDKVIWYNMDNPNQNKDIICVTTVKIPE
jgi:hypothetical protein